MFCIGESSHRMSWTCRHIYSESTVLSKFSNEFGFSAKLGLASASIIIYHSPPPTVMQVYSTYHILQMKEIASSIAAWFAMFTMTLRRLNKIGSLWRVDNIICTPAQCYHRMKNQTARPDQLHCLRRSQGEHHA